MGKPTVVILGAGLAGLGAAWQLTRRGLAHVCVLEQSGDIGGNAGSFKLAGIPVDYGSHRLHPACDARILDDIRMLLGADLLTRPRHGRIRLAGRWIHFPLQVSNLLTNLPWGFRLHLAGDIMRKVIPPLSQGEPPSFASVLERGLGRTICREFYFPYAQKIWGLPPDELSPSQARRRVSAASLGKMLRSVLAGGRRSSGMKGCFLYPHSGFGQIAGAMAAAARNVGADLRLQAVARAIRLGPPHSIEVEQNGQITSIRADYVWSTIPIDVVLRLLHPAVPGEVLEASRQMRSRAMVLVYLVLGQPRFSEYDAHYFPGPETPLTRLSEPKNYSARTDPSDRTVLCGELPCDANDGIWRMNDEALAGVVCQSLDRYGLPIDAPILNITTRRLTHAYPIYPCGYEECFRLIDQWLGERDGFLSFGRQGLFAHDNIHHTLAMAYAATDCLDGTGRFDRQRWHAYRVEFEKQVVVD